MLPLLAIGGIIGAVMSIGKGASWVADQVAPTNEAGASADKSTATPSTAMTSAFEKALAAQAAGQTMPGTDSAAQMPTATTSATTLTAMPATATTSATTPPMASAPGGIIHLTNGTDYDVKARIQAGIAAYGNIGERHGQHGGTTPSQGTGNDISPPPADWDGAGRKASVISAS